MRVLCGGPGCLRRGGRDDCQWKNNGIIAARARARTPLTRRGCKSYTRTPHETGDRTVMVSKQKPDKLLSLIFAVVLLFLCSDYLRGFLAGTGTERWRGTMPLSGALFRQGQIAAVCGHRL